MKRIDVRKTARALLVAALAATLLSGSGDATGRPAEDTVISPGVPASRYWPAEGDDAGCPPQTGSWCAYRLTEGYGARFRDCLKSKTFERCRDSLPAEYRVTREH